MVKVNPVHMDPHRAPQFMDACGKCGHTQNYHLTTKGHAIEGFRKDCWFGVKDVCGCATFVSTWGHK
jgi:hypothetical protein